MSPRKKRKAKHAEELTLLTLSEKQLEFRKRHEKRMKAKEQK